MCCNCRDKTHILTNNYGDLLRHGDRVTYDDGMKVYYGTLQRANNYGATINIAGFGEYHVSPSKMRNIQYAKS